MSPVSLGSDSQAVVDPFEEMRALDSTEGWYAPAWRLYDRSAVESATSAGYPRLATRWRSPAAGLAGRLRHDFARWARARRDEVNFLLEAAVFAARARDVTDVVVDGRPIVAAAPFPGRRRGGHAPPRHQCPPAAVSVVVFDDIGLLVTNDPAIGQGPLGCRAGSALVAVDGRVAWVGAPARCLKGPVTSVST